MKTIFLAGSAICAAVSVSPSAQAVDYYVSNAGSNTNAGTSSSAPWADFTNINGRTFAAGDNIYLACGSAWNQKMSPLGSGTSSLPITITSFGSGSMPEISRNTSVGDTCIYLANASYWRVQGLFLSNASYGVEVNYTAGTFGNVGITIANNIIYNMSAIGHGSAGIYIRGGTTLPNSSQWTCKNIVIWGNCIYGSEVGVLLKQFDGSLAFAPYSFQGVTLANNIISGINGSAIVLYGTKLARIWSNHITDCAQTGVAGGTTGLFHWTTDQVTWLNNWCNNIPNTGSSDQCWMDQEGYVDHTTFYSNYFGMAAGAGIEFLQLSGAGTSPPRNPATDYNRNNYLDGNIFVNNGATNNGAALWSTHGSGNTNVITGTLYNNLYYEPSLAWTNFDGLTSFIQSNNYSVTDSIYNSVGNFSDTQGSGQFTYQAYTSGVWNYMTYNSTLQRWTDANGGYTARFNMRAPSSTSNAVARTWTAPTTGTVRIRGRVFMNLTGGSGVNAYWGIKHNGVWTQMWTQSVTGNDQSGFNSNYDNLVVTAGDIINFYIFPKANNDPYAVVSWVPTISY